MCARIFDPERLKADDPLAVPLAVLLQIYDGASFQGLPRWQGAVPWPVLHAGGMTEDEAQDLLRRGYLAHRWEQTTATDTKRQFRNPPEETLNARSCLILTQQGINWARRCLGDVHVLKRPLRERPVWDATAGELLWQGQLVKRFRHDAANQRRLMDAFAAAGWPHCVPSPFPSSSDSPQKKCLYWTIAGLNQSQRGPLKLRFRADGRGHVCWEPSINKHG